MEKLLEKILLNLENFSDILFETEIFGLCYFVDYLYIVSDTFTVEETITFQSYLKDNKPTKKNYYNLNGSYEKGSRSYYWIPGNKKPRINWLKKHIKILTKNK